MLEMERGHHAQGGALQRSANVRGEDEALADPLRDFAARTCERSDCGPDAIPCDGPVEPDERIGGRGGISIPDCRRDRGEPLRVDASPCDSARREWIENEQPR